MKHYFLPEKLSGENKYDCLKCKKYTNAVKSVTLDSAPVNLIINLKKFDKFGAKIKSDLKYPVNFDLNDFIPKGKSRRKSQPPLRYELYGVVNHEGKFSHKGHYNCYVKNHAQKWFLCDDSRVVEVGSDSQTRNSSKAYMLFYRLASD